MRWEQNVTPCPLLKIDPSPKNHFDHQANLLFGANTMALCHHTFSSGCARRSTHTIWHPSFPSADLGPKPVCDQHFDPESCVVNGWFADKNADIAFKDCEFINRASDNVAYHNLLVAMAKHGSFMCGRELGQPIDPADKTVYVWNGYGWLVRFDCVIMLGDWNIVKLRYTKMLNGPKIRTDKKTLMSFFE